LLGTPLDGPVSAVPPPASPAGWPAPHTHCEGCEGPACGAFKRAAGRSKVFIELVEQHDPHRDASAQDGINIYLPRAQLPEDPMQRKQVLISLYTGNALYHVVNRCLLYDDAAKMRPLAGYIRELREVFRADLAPRLLAPFTGRVYRGITLADPGSVLQGLQVGEEFVWAAFTSTSPTRPFGGNIKFEIQCSLAIDGQTAHYAPGRVAHCSQFVNEDEVLFPPHVRFRVMSVQGNVVQLEAVEFPPVWDMTAGKV